MGRQLEAAWMTGGGAPGVSWLTMDDGQRLYVRNWRNRSAPRAVLIVHGLGEHSGRYKALARWFIRQGYAVRSYDQRGHGHTPGPRAALRRSDDLLTDLAAVYRHYASDFGTPPLLLGHSMGGVVALRAVLDDRVQPPALVLSSPALRAYAAPWLRRLAGGLARALPDLPLRTGLPPAGLSHDVRVIEAYRGDPLCSNHVTPRMADFIFRAGASCIADAARLRVPTLLLAAGSDRLVDPSGSRDFADAARGATPLTARFFDTLFHELFNEAEAGRRQVLAQLEGWLRRMPW